MDLNIFSLFWQATLIVKLVMVLLLLMSIYSLTLIIYKIISFNSATKKSLDGIASFDTAKDLREAVQRLATDPDSPLYSIAQYGVVEYNRSKEAGVEEEIVVDNVRRSLHQGVALKLDQLTEATSGLATIANTAPFIGLFGTVIGIINAFSIIGQMRSASLATVAPAISEALIATALGLFVAIPASVAYNYLLAKIGRVENQLINFAAIFLNRVQREINAHMGHTQRRSKESDY